ncbi:MAG: lysine 2,3-aminomutase [Bacteroidetes bacterium]|nr:lysine 2,3-aminomutase [Bacteroidota bacterium]
MRPILPPGRARPHVYDARQRDVEAFNYFTERNLDAISQIHQLPADLRFDMQVVSSVLPFKVNSYVVDQLIDWSDIPDDPIFQLTFPQKGMLSEEHFERMATLHRRAAPRAELKEEANRIRLELNPHPAGQTTLNVPRLDQEPLPGLQHKYRETVLFFPTAGQTCHAYCTFCFRWAQFVGMSDLRFAAKEATQLAEYVRRHPEVTNVLLTGGDPMVMKTHKLEQYVNPLLDPALEHLQTIRFGTKSVAYWPQRFVTDADADDLLRLFDRIIESGRSVAVMAHYNHHREMETAIAREAVRRIRDTGAVIRSQSPLLSHINDNAGVWELMWREQVRLGIIPYYMFVERDTGAEEYFKIPLARAYKLFREAYRHVNGLARTVRGPSMSANPGKVEITGVTEVAGEKVFVLRFLQGRNPDWVGRPFFARYDKEASWMTHLRPAFGQEKFFFEEELERMTLKKEQETRLE